MDNLKYTPENITSLGEDEVFVFGSNLRGMHCGGAARTAVERFGAIMGQGEGMQGQSYAIPTMQGGVETIKPYVDRFIDLATEWDQTTFYVTRIGCGIAGFKDEDIAPLFDRAYDLYNVRLPESFAKIIRKNRENSGH
jgi:O-acetyl-ADP-ribose deacetylase (regulator of RNase III)